MNKLWRGIVRTIFWSYDRGSWPYDLMVLLILAFVLLTPRGWFRDQPQAAASNDSGVILMAQNPADRTRTYRVDAKLLDPKKRAPQTSPELERETHDILSREASDLKDHRFQIVRITAVRADDGSIQSYEVVTRQ
jgi:hypothetical protein